jgi:hypothetical protein
MAVNPVAAHADVAFGAFLVCRYSDKARDDKGKARSKLLHDSNSIFG